jgi:hypothetical protein
VKFVFADSPAPVRMGPSTSLDQDALAKVPLPLRMGLEEAIVSLDSVGIAGSIRTVAELNPVLGSFLSHHATQLHYTIILKALQACRGELEGEAPV